MSKKLGDTLSDDIFRLLTSKIPTTIVATVSGDCMPNTTPVHLVYAIDRKTISMALSRQHRATSNIRENGKVIMCVCEEGDLNVSIGGRARVVKEVMDNNKAMCLVLLDIEFIKDDSTHSETISGIRYRCRTERGEEFIRTMFSELERYAEKTLKNSQAIR